MTLQIEILALFLLHFCTLRHVIQSTQHHGIASLLRIFYNFLT